MTTDFHLTEQHILEFDARFKHIDTLFEGRLTLDLVLHAAGDGEPTE